MARPNRYETEVKDRLVLIEGWSRDGLTKEQIASNLSIHISTLCDWQNRYPEFAEALKNGRDVADYMVENALFKKATEGDNVAMIFWLKNRRSDKWRDKPDSEEKLKKLISLLAKLNLSEDEVNELMKEL